MLRRCYNIARLKIFIIFVATITPYLITLRRGWIRLGRRLANSTEVIILPLVSVQKETFTDLVFICLNRYSRFLLTSYAPCRSVGSRHAVCVPVGRLLLRVLRVCRPYAILGLWVCEPCAPTGAEGGFYGCVVFRHTVFGSCLGAHKVRVAQEPRVRSGRYTSKRQGRLSTSSGSGPEQAWK